MSSVQLLCFFPTRCVIFINMQTCKSPKHGCLCTNWHLLLKLFRLFSFGCLCFRNDLCLWLRYNRSVNKWLLMLIKQCAILIIKLQKRCAHFLSEIPVVHQHIIMQCTSKPSQIHYHPETHWHTQTYSVIHPHTRHTHTVVAAYTCGHILLWSDHKLELSSACVS